MDGLEITNQPKLGGVGVNDHGRGDQALEKGGLPAMRLDVSTKGFVLGVPAGARLGWGAALSAPTSGPPTPLVRSDCAFVIDYLFVSEGDVNSPPPPLIRRRPSVTGAPERHLATTESAAYRSRTLDAISNATPPLGSHLSPKIPLPTSPDRFSTLRQTISQGPYDSEFAGSITLCHTDDTAEAISVRLDEETERALQTIEATGLTRSEEIRSSLLSSAARLQRGRDLAAEAAVLDADEADREEMLAVASLMESLRAPR